MKKSLIDTKKYPWFLPRLLCVLCAIQPVLDALSYWQSELGIGGTSVLRAFLLLLLAGMGFAVSDRKRLYVLLFGVLGLFWAAHCFSCCQNGYSGWQEDLSNFIRVLQLPVTTFALISCLRREDDCLDGLLCGLFLAFCVILFLQILSLVTGTEPYTYPNKQLGLRGWCFWPNAQSAILSLLAPMAILYALRRWENRFWVIALISAVSFSLLWLHGTRLAYLCLLMTAAGLALTALIKKLPKRYFVLFLVCCLVFGCLLPVSPMTRNQQKVEDNAVRKQEILTTLIEENEEAAAQYEQGSDAYRAARLELAYRFFLPGLVERFGIQKTAEVFDYSEDAAVVANERTWKLHYCKLLMEDSNTKLSRLFGLNVSDMVAANLSHDCENDLHAMYYLYGYAGLTMLLLFLAYFLFLIVRAMLKNAKKTFTVESACIGIALLSLLAHTYFTCGVLRRTNTLFYFGVILALVYRLTREEDPSRLSERKEAQI